MSKFFDCLAFGPVASGLDPSRQLIAAQCSGALVLAKLGLLDSIPACTDLTTKPWVIAAGVEVLDQPFFARDNVATASGCLASYYLAAWIITRLRGTEAAEGALHYVAPVGEKEEYIKWALRNIDSGRVCHSPAARPGRHVGHGYRPDSVGSGSIAVELSRIRYRRAPIWQAGPATRSTSPTIVQGREALHRRPVTAIR
ncbi:hypothetical protein Vqi01_51870 [Micromonospora qiuiae]|uniref:DJ-1/PfpI domain-containing protein n=1 Tax=Micromonospora qiuiae TaxID=502268 RepID=A0ABQ4JHC2_9ACTN|nr:hypothetical protein [Micromonospora qiuiae]GIJ30025.1 hypothetical protein Vqi01_51870 [Micromonospora qiuiae]